jgi:putative selenate reductase
MVANGVEMERKGPAFQTNVEGVWCAGDAHRGPATIVEGIADAAAFAEAVTGKKHEYRIPEEAYPAKAAVVAKKGVLAMATDVCCEGERCLQCRVICENCVDSCPNRANVVIRLANGSHQILHVDKMCNECGNCTQFCPYSAEPCHDKLTLFQTAEDMEDSKNAGVLFLADGKARVRLFDGVKEYDLDAKETDLPPMLLEFLLTVRDKYSYLYQ